MGSHIHTFIETTLIVYIHMINLKSHQQIVIE